MHDSKICFKCEKLKPLSDFYKHKGMSDGRLNKCKECNRKDVILNRLKNIDYYREYDKSRANLPHRIEGREKYFQTEEGRLVARKAKNKWSANNVIKKSASMIINNHIRDNKLIKPDICESCGGLNKNLHGHHDDYALPLIVRWLCSKCHRDWHRKNGSGINGE